MAARQCRNGERTCAHDIWGKSNNKIAETGGFGTYFYVIPSILTPEVMAAVAEGVAATLVTIPTTAEMTSAAAPTIIKTAKANTKLTKITAKHDKCQKNRQ